jgi:hypothetical protein
MCRISAFTTIGGSLSFFFLLSVRTESTFLSCFQTFMAAMKVRLINFIGEIGGFINF